jgi:hypothetical protein
MRPTPEEDRADALLAALRERAARRLPRAGWRGAERPRNPLPPPPSTPPTAWCVADVGAWLAGALELPQYMPAFRAASVDGPLLLTLNDADLERGVGVGHALHRRKLLAAIDRLRGGDSCGVSWRTGGAGGPGPGPYVLPAPAPGSASPAGSGAGAGFVRREVRAQLQTPATNIVAAPRQPNLAAAGVAVPSTSARAAVTHVDPKLLAAILTHAPAAAPLLHMHAPGAATVAHASAAPADAADVFGGALSPQLDVVCGDTVRLRRDGPGMRLRLAMSTAVSDVSAGGVVTGVCVRVHRRLSFHNCCGGGSGTIDVLLSDGTLLRGQPLGECGGAADVDDVASATCATQLEASLAPALPPSPLPSPAQQPHVHGSAERDTAAAALPPSACAALLSGAHHHLQASTTTGTDVAAGTESETSSAAVDTPAAVAPAAPAAAGSGLAATSAPAPEPPATAAASSSSPASPSRVPAGHDAAGLRLEIGDRVEARYRGRGRTYYPGVITQIVLSPEPAADGAGGVAAAAPASAADVRFSILYDDGDRESGAVASSIRKLPPPPLPLPVLAAAVPFVSTAAAAVREANAPPPAAPAAATPAVSTPPAPPPYPPHASVSASPPESPHSRRCSSDRRSSGGSSSIGALAAYAAELLPDGEEGTTAAAVAVVGAAAVTGADAPQPEDDAGSEAAVNESYRYTDAAANAAADGDDEQRTDGGDEQAQAAASEDMATAVESSSGSVPEQLPAAAPTDPPPAPPQHQHSLTASSPTSTVALADHSPPPPTVTFPHPHPAPPPRASYAVGDRVEARYRGRGTLFYPGLITAVATEAGDGSGAVVVTYGIQYDDGDEEAAAEEANVRLLVLADSKEDDDESVLCTDTDSAGRGGRQPDSKPHSGGGGGEPVKPPAPASPTTDSNRSSGVRRLASATAWASLSVSSTASSGGAIARARSDSSHCRDSRSTDASPGSASPDRTPVPAATSPPGELRRPVTADVLLFGERDDGSPMMSTTDGSSSTSGSGSDCGSTTSSDSCSTGSSHMRWERRSSCGTNAVTGADEVGEDEELSPPTPSLGAPRPHTSNIDGASNALAAGAQVLVAKRRGSGDGGGPSSPTWVPAVVTRVGRDGRLSVRYTDADGGGSRFDFGLPPSRVRRASG